MKTWEKILSTIYGVTSLLAAAAIYVVGESNRNGRALYGAQLPNFNPLWKLWVPLTLLSISLFVGYRVAQGVFIAMSATIGAGMILDSIIPSNFVATLSGIGWGIAFLVPSVLTLFIWCKQPPQLHHGT